MAFEKLKKPNMAQPRPAPLAAPSAPVAQAKPGVAQQVGGQLVNGLVSKGTSALLGGLGGGAAAGGLGAAAMTNPVTAPLALGAMAAKKLAGK